MSERYPTQKLATVPGPRNAAERSRLCGVALDAIEPYWDTQTAANNHATFFIVGAIEPRKDTVRGWELFRAVTGRDPGTIPQPTGNCVAASAEEIVELTQCVDILRGDREVFTEINSSYHYATGRVIIGQNRLKGSPGSIGGWQASAVTRHGTLALNNDHPEYNKGNVDAWGDDRKAEGKSFRDYIDEAAPRTIGTTARVTSMTEIMDAQSSGYFQTIASNRGYSRKPKGGETGWHVPSGRWSHQMSLWGYSISHEWVAIKNQWGPKIHGRIRDPETQELWPAGFLKVRMDDFEKKHLRGSECITYSQFAGFPQKRFDYSVLG